MVVIKVLITLLLFIGVVIALNKKLSPAITLMMFGLGALVIGVFVNGYDLLGEKTTGFFLFDIFEYFRTSAVVDTISRNGVRIMAILAYVAYMDHLKASTLFALVVSKPCMKIKNKYLLAGAVYLLTVLLLLVIPNGTGRIALLLGTVYPVMLACGISKPTAAVAIFAGAMNGWGPTNAKIPVAANYMGIEVNMAQHFLTTEWMWDILAFATCIIVFIVTSKYFDRKENAETGEGVFSGISIESLGVPMWYIVLPLVPVVAIMMFGGSFKPLPALEIATVMFMCFVLVFLLIFLTSKAKKQTWNNGNEFFVSLGQTMTRNTSVMIGAITFGAGITSIGGIAVLLDPFLSAGEAVNVPLFVIGTAVVAILIGMVSVSDYVANSIIGPVYTTVATAANLNVNAFLLLTVNTFQMSFAFSPASPHVAITSGTTQVPINTIIKRTIAPVASSMVVYIIGTIIMA